MAGLLQASPDEATVRGETPLHLAARANQTDIIRILLRNGAKVDARARVRRLYIIRILLRNGAKVDARARVRLLKIVRIPYHYQAVELYLFFYGLVPAFDKLRFRFRGSGSV